MKFFSILNGFFKKSILSFIIIVGVSVYAKAIEYLEYKRPCLDTKSWEWQIQEYEDNSGFRPDKKSVKMSVDHSSGEKSDGKVGGKYYIWKEILSSTENNNLKKPLIIDKAKKVWARKTINIPDSWKGDSCILELNLNAEADLYVNGKFLGTLHYPSDEIDISKFIEYGSQNEILFLLTSEKPLCPMRKVALDEINKRKEHNEFRPQENPVPIIKQMQIYKMSKFAGVKDVLLMPSVRKKELGLRINIDADGSVKNGVFSVKINELNGKTVKEYKNENFEIKNGWQEIYIPWNDPKLWGIDNPNLYYFEACIKNEKEEIIERIPSIRFGFREFWIEGKELFLNGSPLHIGALPFPATVPNYNDPKLPYKYLKDLGYNGIFIQQRQDVWNNSCYNISPNFNCGAVNSYKIGDELGVVVYGIAPDMLNLYSMPEALEPEGDLQKAYQREFYRYNRKIWNHPCIIAYIVSFGGPRTSRVPLPWNYGSGVKSGYFTDADFEKMTAGIKKIDPIHPLLGHNTSVGDLDSVFIYENWMPQQEYEEFLSKWTKDGIKPLVLSECATPIIGDFNRREAITDPLVTEYSAIYLGDKAYELEERRYTELVDSFAEAYKSAEKDLESKGTDESCPTWLSKVKGFYSVKGKTKAFNLGYYDKAKGSAYYDIMANALRGFKYWKADGFNGGIVHWLNWIELGLKPLNSYSFSCSELSQEEYKNIPETPFPVNSKERPSWATKIFDAVKYIHSPLLIYIGGYPVHYGKKHNYFSGQKIEKQLVFVWDKQENIDLTYQIIAKTNGKILLDKKQKINLAPSEIKKIKFEFVAPMVSTVTNGSIDIVSLSSDGRIEGKDAFKFTVFPDQNKIDISKNVYYWSSKNWLKQELFKIIKDESKLIPAKKGIAPNGDGILIIGRNALESFGSLEVLKDWVGKGNRILILEQSRNTLSKLGFRSIDQRSRDVFVRSSKDPLTNNLTDENFKNWGGCASILNDYGIPEDSYSRSPHWGNRGTVASISIETPQKGPFTPVLQCEFDMSYTPLLRMKYKKGEIIFSQLDLTDRKSPNQDEPMVDIMFARLLKEADTSALLAGKTVLYSGNDKYYEWIKTLGFEIKKINSLNDVQSNDILIIDETIENAKELIPIIQNGLRLIVLPRATALVNETKDFGFIPCKTLNKLSAAGKSKIPETVEELVGLGPSELHWRALFDIYPLTSSEQLKSGEYLSENGVIGVKKYGNGVIVQIQLGREQIKEKSHVAKYTLWKYDRILSQILKNMDAAHLPDTLAWNLDFCNEFKIENLNALVLDTKDEKDLNIDFFTDENSLQPEKDAILLTGKKLDWLPAAHTKKEEQGNLYMLNRIRQEKPFAKKKMAYLIGNIYAEKDCNAIGEFDFDWWGKVIVNGKEIFTLDQNVREDKSAKQTETRFPLKKGKNTILVKGVSGSQGWMFTGKITSEPTSSDLSLYSGALKKGDRPYYHHLW